MKNKLTYLYPIIITITLSCQIEKYIKTDVSCSVQYVQVLEIKFTKLTDLFQCHQITNPLMHLFA